MDINAKDSLRAFRVLSSFMPEYVGQQLDNQHFLMQKVCKQVLILAAYEKYNQEQIIILRKVDKRMLIETMLTRFRNTRNTDSTFWVGFVATNPTQNVLSVLR